MQFRQEETAAELLDFRKRCDYLERDNADLYNKLNDYRLNQNRLVEFDSVVKQLNETVAAKQILEYELRNQEMTNKNLNDECLTLRSQYQELNECYSQARDELRQMKEKSLSM